MERKEWYERDERMKAMKGVTERGAILVIENNIESGVMSHE